MQKLQDGEYENVLLSIMLIFNVDNADLSGRTKIQLTLNVQNSILKPDKQEGTVAEIARKSLDFQ